jgi:hypothetical protein
MNLARLAIRFQQTLSNETMSRAVGSIWLLLALAIWPLQTFGESTPVTDLTSERHDYLTPPLDSWTPQEKWVWSKVRAGEIADLNKRERLEKDLDARKSEEWTRGRILRPRFIETILLSEPFRASLTHNGVWIVGAWFADNVDLSHSHIDHMVRFDNCRFDDGMNLDYAHVSDLFIFNHSKIAGSFSAENINTDTDFWIYDSELSDAVFLKGKVGGSFVLWKTIALKKLNLNSIEVADNIYMHSGNFTNVDLSAALIKRNLTMDNSTLSGDVEMDILRVEGNVYMQNLVATEVGVLTVNYSQITGSLFLAGSTFSKLSLKGTQIGEQMQLADDLGKSVSWPIYGEISLRDVKVGTLQESKDAWPNSIILGGFSYGNIVSTKDDFLARSSGYFIDWLNRSEYSAQIYEELSKFMEQSGARDKADDLRYAGDERQRSLSYGAKWIAQTLSKWIIGYGHGRRVFRCLYWVLAFWLIGFLFLFTDQETRKRGKLWCVIFSIDKLLPIIKLEEENYRTKIKGAAKYYFYFQTIMGYVLASFLIAGISGLTK